MRRQFIVFFTLVFWLLGIGAALSASDKPKTAEELALYQGADRQQILEAGAKKEGKLTFYTVGILTQSVRPIVDAFQKKYPYIKVDIWRAGTNKLIPRIVEEFKAGKTAADAVVVTQAGELVLEEGGILQPFYSPSLAILDQDAIKRGPQGAQAAGVYETTRGIGYHTKLISKDDVPKTHQDLLNPKWKGKVAIAGSNTGVNWMGTLLDAYGEDFVRKLAKQNFEVHMVSARAILDLVIAGEYLFSPTVSDSHAGISMNKGAPINWIPLEPAPSYLGSIMIPKGFPHPHAALLFADFNLSEQVADIYINAGYTSPRKLAAGERRYKRYYGPFSLKQEKKWNDLFNTLFVNK